jgi:hypothetical protein
MRSPTTRNQLHDLLDDLLQQPPPVHGDAAPRGIWTTDEELYRDLIERLPADAVTLETGAGLSTMLLAAGAAAHHCVTPAASEVAVLKQALSERGVAPGAVIFHIDRSDRILPRLETDLDLVLIDGGHAYPTPQIDWYYAGSRLRRGGLLYLDDLQLPAVDQLAAFLRRDPRWHLLRRTAKWGVWLRREEGELAEEWTDQKFWRPPLWQRARWLFRRAWRRIGRSVRRADRPRRSRDGK